MYISEKSKTNTPNTIRKITPFSQSSPFSDLNLVVSNSSTNIPVNQCQSGLNKIKSLHPGSVCLFLDKTGQGIARITSTELSSKELDALRKLETLYLNDNDLTETDLANLKKSILSSNRLVMLDLQNNKLNSIPNLNYIHTLRRLNLSGNPLENFEASCLPRSLISITLDESQIEMFSQKLTKAGFSLTTVKDKTIFLDPKKHKESNAGLSLTEVKDKTVVLDPKKYKESKEEPEKILNKIENKVKTTGILDFTGITDSDLIKSALLSDNLRDYKINTVIFSHCNLTSLPDELFKEPFNQMLSLKLDGNLSLTELPKNIDTMLPNLRSLDISDTKINKIDEIINLIAKNLRTFNLSGTPLEVSGEQDVLVSFLLEKCPSFKMKNNKNGSVSIILKEYTKYIRESRASLIKQGAVLIEPRVSQNKGRFQNAIPGGICVALSISLAEYFLENNEIVGFLKKIYPDWKKNGKKGEINEEYLSTLINLQEKIDTESSSRKYLEEKNLQFNLVKNYTHEIDGVEKYSDLLVETFSNDLQKKLLATTEQKIFSISLFYEKEYYGHDIIICTSGQKNSLGEKKIYFFDPNVGPLEILITKDSDQLARSLLAYYSQPLSSKPNLFKVYEIKKNIEPNSKPEKKSRLSRFRAFMGFWKQRKSKPR